MGFDVYGNKPTTEAGRYFRNTVWYWHPLADYIQTVAPDIAEHCHYWHTNDADGLGAEDARALAAILRRELKNGSVDDYALMREASLNALPDEPCQYCNATGTRSDPVGIELGMAERKWCNGCDGKGTVRPWETHYDFAVENLQAFTDFLEHCGGFKIH